VALGFHRVKQQMANKRRNAAAAAATERTFI